MQTSAALVTGGAGFIGSHVVDALVDAGHSVRVLDDLFTGSKDNVNPAADLIVASVADEDAVRAAVDGCDRLFHLGAHRAVGRSVTDPLATDLANVHGTLTVLDAAHRAGVRRVVSASSSSVYGGSAPLPTAETAPLTPRSPYAVSKMAGEHYCRVYSELFGVETVSVRFFNVYGPRQRPDSPYAAVIPLFIEALRKSAPPTVHGDGRQSRDFTYVADAVAATLAAADAPADRCAGRAYNIAPGESHDLLEVLDILGRLLGVVPRPEHTAPRSGDVRLSKADPSAARRDLGVSCATGFEEGLRRTVEWFEAG
ncbi:MAG TPA: NAD-dependent epimerase/dehydratase family protein [Acidimicrobiia bacterium]|nr:NAD-dependent epimerase/dehydratase family protein [Acidimicrobiia bacterium]